MEVLILSCGTGGGHDSAGKAIMEELIKRGHHVKMINPYTLKSSKLSGRIDRTYIKMVQHTPNVFGAVYKIGDVYRRLPFRSPVYYANQSMNHVMQEYFETHPVDIVIMPHLFPAEILTNMKRHDISVPKTMFIATDYVCIPFTEDTECDAYVIPAEDLTQEFACRGIPEEKIYPIGIPTKQRFSKSKMRAQEKKRLGFDPEKKYILVAGGSMGGGKIEKFIQILQHSFAEEKDVELVVVCGSNRKLYQKLRKQSMQGMTVIDYTEHMASYMRACDLFITKPGGLSSTEAAQCGIPILYTAVIPGCESCNEEYFNRHGMSISGESSKDFLSKVSELLQNDAMGEKMIACQKKAINKNAASDICRLAEQMVENTASEAEQGIKQETGEI